MQEEDASGWRHTGLLWIETGKQTLPGSPAFVSYAREDAAFALRLAADLKASGAHVWIDQLDIRPGRQWDSEVEKALTAASELLVILSPAAVDSDNVLNEVAFALDESKTVIPLMHRECRVPFRLRRLHYIDFKADYQSSLQVLLRELAEGGLIAPVSAEEAVREKADGPEKPTHGEPSPVPAPSVEPKPRQSARPPFRPSRRILSLSAAGLACVIGLGRYVLSRPSGGSPSVPPAVATQTHSAAETKVNPKDNLRYVWIRPGQFTMGCSPGDSECYDEKPAHEVSISHGFWMGQTEVTQATYKAVTGKPNPGYFKGDDLPVEQVTWQDAKSYCEAVGMRLPTEAEWEYAARARSTAARYGNLNDVAWYTGNSDGRTHPVAQKSPNAWGLYDVLGNVWEWCGDWYDQYPAESQQDPTGPKSGTQKTVRGGSWYVLPWNVRVSYRVRLGPSIRDNGIGFRCSGELR